MYAQGFCICRRRRVSQNTASIQLKNCPFCIPQRKTAEFIGLLKGEMQHVKSNSKRGGKSYVSGGMPSDCGGYLCDSKRDRKGTSEEERHAPEQYAHPPGCYRRRIFSYCGGPDVF